MNICSICKNETLSCLTNFDLHSKVITCDNCYLNKKNNEMENIQDVSNWWKLQKKVYFKRKTIKNNAEKIKKWWILNIKHKL